MNPLKLIKPLAITDAVLTSSSIAETDYPAWNSATAYAVGAKVIRTSTHRIYERIIAGTTVTAPESDAANWLDYSATNRWKMFDSLVGSQSTAGGTITVTLTPGTVFNAVALVNISATSVRVKVTNEIDGVVYDKTKTTQAPIATPDYWAYFFEPITQNTTAVFLDLPTYGVNTTVEITITGGAACGHCLIGTQYAIGDFGVQRGAQVGITDYSRKEKNAFGEYSVVERAWNKRSRMDVLVSNNKLDGLQSLFASIRTTPTLWVGSDQYESLTVFGYYRDFAAVISYPNYSQMNLEIEGLI